MFVLFAQLIDLPLQGGPTRLPAPALARPAVPRAPSTPPDTPRSPGGARPPVPVPGAEAPGQTGAPVVRGSTVYSAEVIARLLEGCREAGRSRREQLQACADALTARYVADGYVNSRVLTPDTPDGDVLEVIEGRISEIRVRSDDSDWRTRIQRQLQGLRGSILHLPTLERSLNLLRTLPGVKTLRSSLTRLGSDPSEAVVSVTVQASPAPWQGDISLRNDGSNGSGEARAVLTLLKPDALKRGDTLLLYNEVNGDDTPALGSLITAFSYTYPLSDTLALTSSLGFTRRNLIELPAPLDGFSTSQYQGVVQLEWTPQPAAPVRWSFVAGASASRSNNYLNDQVLPAALPSVFRSPQSGYLRLGFNASQTRPTMSWSSNVSLLQGLAALTPEDQRQEQAIAGISPADARALSGYASAGWLFAPGWNVQLLAAGQVAFNPLTGPMQFTLGSDTGLRGLPGQLLSGDSGWLSSVELSWTVWQNRRHALQLVPFIGMGGVSTQLKDIAPFRDTIGSGGILARWLVGDHWQMELGWIDQFQSDDNPGEWLDWALGQGLYAQIRYRF
ncbi:MAG: ShlB/FhaC/HecB family hemolysin secretion/activation protein [Cyanobium sp.]